MKLSRIQKFALVFFISTFLPAYLIANWRHEANLSLITEKFEREQTLHLSTDKLVSNCERNEEKNNDHYSANHQICNQGLQEHAATSHAMDRLNQEKARNDMGWYRNLFLSVAIFNLFGLLAYQANQFLKRKEI